MAANLSSSYSLPPHLVEVARRELRETPAVRAECLRQLRRRLQEQSKTSFDTSCDDEEDTDGEEGEQRRRDRVGLPDDRFLLRFLRSKKFDVRRSHDMYECYRQFYSNNPAMETELDPRAVRHVWDSAVLGGLKGRDRRGRSVLVAFPGRWNPATHALEDILRAMLMQLEYLIMSEETQVNGIVLVADFKDFSLHHVRCLKSWYFQTVATLVQNAFPVRFKGVYIVNQPWYISIPLSLLRPFLSEKMKKRINIFGSNMTILDKYLPGEVLPAEFGGCLPSYSGREWAELIIESRKKWDQLGFFRQRYSAEEEEEEGEGVRERSRSSSCLQESSGSLQESSGSLQYKD